MPKEKRFNCRISAEDHEKISSKAAEAGMTMTDFVIASCMNKRITVINDLKPMVNQLRRAGITYTCPDGSRCRDDKLHEEKYMKENMEYEFRIRQEIVGGIQAGDSGSHESGGTGRAGGDIDRAELQGSDRSDGQAERVAFNSVSGAGKADDGGGYEDRDADSDGRADEDVPESVDRYADYFIVNEGGEREYVHTGWEDERGSLTVSGRAEEAYDKIYDEAVADFDDGKLDMLIDGAYLAAGVMSLIDEDEVVEDSTQIPSADSRRRKEEKMKQYGIAPTM